MGMTFAPLETNEYLCMNAIAIHSKYGGVHLGYARKQGVAVSYA